MAHTHTHTNTRTQECRVVACWLVVLEKSSPDGALINSDYSDSVLPDSVNVWDILLQMPANFDLGLCHIVSDWRGMPSIMTRGGGGGG